MRLKLINLLSVAVDLPNNATTVYATQCDRKFAPKHLQIQKVNYLNGNSNFVYSLGWMYITVHFTVRIRNQAKIQNEF